MEGASAKMEALQLWFTANGGYLHPSTKLAHSEQYGTHLEAKDTIPEATQILTGPHSIALSALNAMVDDEHPVFKQNATAFTVEALGFFYLMTQWIHKEKSFWKPYLDTLPSPDEGFGTPNFFDDEDLKWIQGTDLHLVYEKRKEIWEKYWRDGVEIFKRNGIDSTPYTWRLFIWAATVYTSRSFGSRSVQPQDSKYWTAYKNGPNGRQTVLLDFSNVPSERKDFPVLFPTVDTLNHDPETPIEWSFDPGRFTLRTLVPNAAGSQVYNNYGPKANGELLMGYGFCVAQNIHDGVLETLKPPPIPLQHLLRRSHPGYFKIDGSWNSEAATFHLRAPPPTISSSPSDIWTSIPDPLIELFYYITRLERGLDVEPIDPSSLDSSSKFRTNDDKVHDFLFSGPGQAYLPRIAFAIVTSLVPKMTRLETATTELPFPEPQNRNQRNAQIYRDGQMRIMTAIREGLAAFNRSLRPPHNLSSFNGSAIWTLDEVLHILGEENQAAKKSFVKGIGISEAQDLSIVGTDVEQRLWVLLVCYLTLLSASSSESGTSLSAKWQRAWRAEYGEWTIGTDEEEEDDASPFLHTVGSAAENCGPDSVWSSEHWNSAFVLDWGMRIVSSQGMMMRIAGDKVRYVVYLHVEP